MSVMSLLEDVFLEDEAGEAQELERVIEGDEFDERPRSRSDSEENSEKEDEAEEDKRRVDPTSAKPKRVIKNPRFVLNPARLTGPRGIQIIPEHFKDFKFRGKGHEREDLDVILKKLEHWAYRLYPKFQFEDCLKKIETLGKKRPVMVHLQKIRNGQITEEQETVVQKDSSDDEAAPAEEDEFDKLLQQQIEKARATPAPGSVKKAPYTDKPSMMPKATSSPSINIEQRERMLQNRRMAEQRRLARLKQNTAGTSLQENEILNPAKTTTENDPETPYELIASPAKHGGNSPSENVYNVSGKRQNKSNVIDSSDDEFDSNGRVDADSNSGVIKRDENGKEASNNSVGKKDEVIELDEFGITATRTKTLNFINDEDGFIELDGSGKVISPIKTAMKSRVEELNDNGVIESAGAIESTDSENDALVINDPVTIEINKKYGNRKIAKPKFIDSSDEEDIVMNESIVVEVHNGIDKNVKNAKERTVISNKDSEIEIGRDLNEINSSSQNKETTKHKDFRESDTLINAVDNISEKKEKDKEINIEQTDANLDELMDVEFSDDF